MRAAARLCSLIENEEPGSAQIRAALYRSAGRARVVGVTGPPGAGKSSLLSCLVEEAVRRKLSVGVLAVDPSSPVTGGALLADRLRIRPSDPSGVFIRSLASRGSRGGLAYAAFGIFRVMEAMGKQIVFVETVGAGQNEIAVAQLAGTTVYVTVPNLGDEIQALKAGILEVCDLFVVNKADLGQAELAVSQLRSALGLKNAESPAGGWVPPILSASAAQRRGVGQIFSSIVEHQEFLEKTGESARRRRKQAAAEWLAAAERRVLSAMQAQLTEQLIDKLAAGKVDPYSLVEEMFSKTAGRKK